MKNACNTGCCIVEIFSHYLHRPSNFWLYPVLFHSPREPLDTSYFLVLGKSKVTLIHYKQLTNNELLTKFKNVGNLYLFLSPNIETYREMC